MSVPSEDDDAELEDPLLRALAAAPPIALGDPPLPADTIVGQTYRVHRVVGAGAMGVVYEATDLVLSRRVALKVHEIGRTDRAARLWREARAMARLSHPNVVTVFEVGIDGSRGWIAMELVDGTNARRWRRLADRTWQDILDVYRKAGAGLAAAHDVGIVHRDFKPDNVLIGRDGRVRVADFGLALQPDQHADETIGAGHVRDDVTRTGVTMGTPAYMAPEQARRERADARSDQFSFCVALHEALHGSRPERREPSTRPSSAAASLPPETAAHEQAAVPTWIGAVLERGLASDPSARHPDMRALVAALDPAPRRRRKVWWSMLLGASLGGVLLVRVGGWLAVDEPAEMACRDAGAAIEDTWSALHANAMRQAFTAAAPTMAESTAAIVVPAFDAWTTTWRDAARDACEATHVRGEQSEQRLDQRMDCLARARLRLAAAVELLSEPDVGTMMGAESVARSLPDLDMCARNDAGIDADPVAPERREDYDRLSAALARVVAEAAAGHFAAAQTALDELVPELEDAGFRRELAEARRVRAAVLLDTGRRTEAIDDAAAAFALSVRFGNRDATTQAMLGLARATGRAAAGFDEAMRWLGAARALADELEWSAARREELRQAELEIAFFADKYSEVERIAGAILGDDVVDANASVRIRVLSLLGTVLERQSRFAEALAIHDEALALVERVRGPDNPQTAMVLGNRIAVLTMLSRPDEVRRSLDRVLEIRIAVFGADAPAVGEVHRQLGDAEQGVGHFDAAVEHYERAVAIHRGADDDVGLFFDLANFGQLMLGHGDTGEAGRLLAEALVHAERAFGADSLRVAQLLVMRGEVRLAEAEYALALADFERALAIMAVTLPVDDLNVGFARHGLARAYVETGRMDEGLKQLEDAAQILESKLPLDNPDRAAFVRSQAEILRKARSRPANGQPAGR